MSDRETLERVVELGDRGSNVLTYEVLAAIYHMLNDHDSVLEDNTRLRAIKRSDTEMIEECRKELAVLANNRDGLEHDWSERGARIDAALALHKHYEHGEGYSSQNSHECSECEVEWPCPTVKALNGEK